MTNDILLEVLERKRILRLEKHKIFLGLFYISTEKVRKFYLPSIQRNIDINRHTKFYTKLFYQADTTIIWRCVYIMAT